MEDLDPSCKRMKTWSRRKPSDKSRITDLPDDILLHILSSLPLKESGRTSILSKRLKHVWSHIPALNFESCNISHEISVSQKALEVDRSRYKSLEPDEHTYAHWVNRVVRSHKAPIVDEIMLQCDILYDSSWGSIDEWFRFAKEKRVKRFGVDIAPRDGDPSSGYTFPSLSFSNSLISLELRGVEVTGETLERFLCNCQNLEFLSVSESESLLSLKVVGPTLSLKYLLISYCNQVNYLEISAPNLVYVNYQGPYVSIPFKNNPKLVEIAVGDEYGADLSNHMMEHAVYLSQLETFTLILQCAITDAMQSIEYPELTRLKKLVVTVDTTHPTYDLRCMQSLIKSCAYMNEFVLEMGSDTWLGGVPLRRWAVSSAHYHHHLKVVKILGFDGHAGFDAAVYLLDISVSLKKIVVDPRMPCEVRNPLAFCYCKPNRDRATGLGEFLKIGTDLLIL